MSDPTTHLDRRNALAAIGGLGGLGALAAFGQTSPTSPNPIRVTPPIRVPGITPEMLGWDAAKGEYTLPPLPYPKEALEPHIDAQTMEIHHGRHHKAYVDGLNRALAALQNIRDGTSDAGLVKHWSREVSFHGCGHINHALFWLMMAPPGTGPGKGGGGTPTGSLAKAIDRDFGSFEKFAAHFKAASVQVEASGWGWLVFEPIAKKLLVIQGERQQDLMLTGAFPILGVDVWEHAYYLKYQNKRADYVNAFFNVINWNFAQKLFDEATR
jgi:superoxide dismutase, Fe-Mn family